MRRKEGSPVEEEEAALGACADGAAVTGERLVLAYGHQVALAPSSFRVPRGAVTALIGPNGAGKSTLLNAIAGLVRPAAGRLRVLGQPPLRTRRRVRYVPQMAAGNRHLPVTVREAVTMGRYAVRGAMRPLTRADRRAVDEALDRLEVGDLARRQLLELSSGQRQRVSVAQGLAQPGDLLLLDESVTGLDLPSQERILEVVEEERRAGRTVLLTTHDLADAARADHVLLLAGRVVAAGRPASVLTTGYLAEAYGSRLVRVDGGALMLDDAAHRHPATASAPPRPRR